jgi:hypothetical protein
MARKPTITPEKQVDLEEAIAANLAPAKELEHLTDVLAVRHAVQAEYSQGRDLANQLLGQAQAAEAIKQISQTIGVSKLAHVKEHKLYRDLAGQLTPNGLVLKGTWEEFCGLLGFSDEKVNQDIANLKAFGEEALESMSRMGIGYREMRQYRRLPEDEKTALIEVAKSGDKEALVEFAEIIFEKHSKEKEEIAKKIEEQQKEFQALETVAKNHKEENNQFRMELAKAKLNTLPWSEVVAPLAEEIANHQAIIDKALDRHLQAISAIDVWHTGLVKEAAEADPYAHVALPQEAITVLMSLEDAITRSAHAIAAIRDHLQNEFGVELMNARRHLLIESEE